MDAFLALTHQWRVVGLGPLSPWMTVPAVELVGIVAVALATRRRPTLRVPLALTTLLLTAAYLIWRGVATGVWNPWGDALAWALLFAGEWLGFFQQVVFLLTMAPTYSRTVPEWPAGRPLPTVDVFVATYDEPLPVLRRTLTACAYIDYPAGRLAVHVLDDGARPEVAALAARLGLRYIARPTHEHAKAGNLNHALGVSGGELVLMLDADMVPKSFILRRLVRDFSAPNLGFVQAPQAFFNADPFQFNLGVRRHVPGEQDFFMRNQLRARERLGAVMYVGSNALFSRAALADIGGFATGSITEDVLTGMLLQAHGYRCAYADEVVATGLAAETFAEMLSQRVRWCRGSLQAARLANPLTLPGLTPAQRLQYLSGLLYWFTSLQKLLYLLMPVLYLDFGILALHATFAGLVTFWLPSFVASLLAFSAVAGGRRTPFWSHLHDIALTPVLSRAVIAELLGWRRPRFRVTRKGLQTPGFRVVGSVFWPLAVLAGLTAVGLWRGLGDLSTGRVPGGPAATTMGETAVLLNLFWAVLNLAGIAVALVVSVDRPRLRAAERVELRLPALLDAEGWRIAGETRDVGEGGALVELARVPPPLHGPVRVVLGPRSPTAGGHGSEGGATVVAEVVRQEVRRGRVLVGLRFHPLTQAQYALLVRLIFDSPEAVAPPRPSARWLAAAARTWLVRPVQARRRETRAACRLPVQWCAAPGPASALDAEGQDAPRRDAPWRPGLCRDLSWGGALLQPQLPLWNRPPLPAGGEGVRLRFLLGRDTGPLEAVVVRRRHSWGLAAVHLRWREPEAAAETVRSLLAGMRGMPGGGGAAMLAAAAGAPRGQAEQMPRPR